MKKLPQFITCSLICFTLLCSRAFAAEHAVAMPDRFAAEAADGILQAGGNAVDAAIAAQFALAVTLPEAGNIGGGGFMLVLKDGKADFLDYREMAPGHAARDMYLDENGEVITRASLYGILASGVPGTVAGMWEAHKKYATLPWATLLQPAVDLAEKGFPVPAQLAGFAQRYIKRMQQRGIEVNFADHFSHMETDVVFRQPELGATLRRIQAKGPEGFYQGTTADLIVEFMQQHNGLINHDDLKAYKAKWRTPLQAQWRGMTVVTAPPPSSGGIAIIQWLKMYDMVKPDVLTPKHNSVEYTHLLAEAGKRVFADRAEYLGDPDFYQVPVQQLIEDDYIRQRTAGISLDKISVSDDIAPGLKESEQTTHFSIVDKWGNAVSNTTTLNLGFGSGMVVTGAGFILNNEMDDFSAKPGTANYFGALGGDANAIEPGKRMLSSMTPSMLLAGDKVRMVTGSPGGTTIISSVYQSILNAVEFGMDAQDVVDSPRFHHQLWPKDTIRHHPGLTEQTVSELKKLGYVLDERRFGDLHVVMSTEKGLQAASESSGRGKAIVTQTN